MADPMVVKRCLKVLATNYGKPDTWVEETFRLWTRGLASLQDKDLMRGVEEWCLKKSFPPNLARLKEVVESNPKTFRSAKPEGCPACHSTGLRELVRHFESHRRPSVLNCVGACDCALGSRLISEAILPWEVIVRMWREDPFTDAVYHSTADRYHLTTEERSSSIQLERYEKIRKAHLKAGTPPKSYSSTWKKVSPGAEI